MARQVIHSGGVIAYPTEAVFGLGCHPLDGSAIARLLMLKQRPMHKGLILIADKFERLRPYLADLPSSVVQRMLQSWPGPTTWLAPAAENIPRWLTGRHATLAIRVTGHPLAANLCRVSQTPLVSTSANLSQRQPARTALQVRLRCGGGVDLVLHGETGGLDRPSVIRDAQTGGLFRG
jgi:L-threonylcarbamoyladenylate synthase